MVDFWWVFPVNYLLGSFPCGLLIGWLVKGVDIRRVGSGNIGATNVSRVTGFAPAVIAGVLDAFKGLLAAFLATHFISHPGWWVLAMIAVVVGHDWSIFLGFKGGKGVATTLGSLLFVSWPSALLCLASWIVIAGVSRYASLGSLIGALLMPIFLLLFGHPFYQVGWGIFAAGLVFWRHEKNIKRLIRGEELRMGQKKECEQNG